MKNRCSFFTLLVAFATFVAAVALAAPQPEMAAHFIYVGQANAALLEFPCGAVLIDAGAENAAFRDSLADYLRTFFFRRTDLANTLDAVFITHSHFDHTRGIRKVLGNGFTVKRHIDSGQVSGSGANDLRWVRTQISVAWSRASSRNLVISMCQRPMLTSILSRAPRVIRKSAFFRAGSMRIPDGVKRRLEMRTITASSFALNFGQASFLFDGDLQKEGIGTLLQDYASSPLLDVDGRIV